MEVSEGTRGFAQEKEREKEDPIAFLPGRSVVQQSAISTPSYL